jgi:peptidoglycan hydrolase-like protein with peptidoglycan-binding domain
MKKIIITFFAILTTIAQSAFAGVDKGINVREVQTLLAELCYDPGPIDGLWGKKAETAVKDLYGSVKGSYDGQFDLSDLGFLREYPIWYGGAKCESIDLVESMDESFKVVTEKEVQIVDPEVCKAQESLSQLGYDIGIADGILRTETLNSLDSFFASQNMTFEGELEANKISYLQKVATKNFARLSGFSTEYKNDFNQKSNLRNKFFHTRLDQEKIENHFSDTCGVHNSYQSKNKTQYSQAFQKTLFKVFCNP